MLHIVLAATRGRQRAYYLTGGEDVCPRTLVNRRSYSLGALDDAQHVRQLVVTTGKLLLLKAQTGGTRRRAGDAGLTLKRRAMERIRIASGGGVAAEILPYGATIAGIFVPDRNGRAANVVLSFARVQDYEEHRHVCCAIGRYANRIAGAKFELDGKTYALPANDGPNTLHGGPGGFDTKTWDIAETSASSVRLAYVSPDGDEGFPGCLNVGITYTAENDALRIDYDAVCDADTIINLTNHTYFNLQGTPAEDASEQLLQIFAARYTPVDQKLIPTGEYASVAATAYDFRNPRPISAYHYDTNFVLDRTENRLGRAAIAGDPVSGRMLEVLTTEPGMQLYTGKAGYFALETQHFPDSPHHAEFPSTVLRAGERFSSTTVYRFFTNERRAEV